MINKHANKQKSINQKMIQNMLKTPMGIYSTCTKRKDDKSS